MEYTPYQTSRNESSIEFEFFSEGPKGRILKKILYKPLDSHPSIFNLSVGDVKADGSIDYEAITNNGDMLIVLATVALTIPAFLNAYPDKAIFVKGHTESRNRLYRRLISNHLVHIPNGHLLYGLVGQKWYLFEKNQNYSGFMLEHKNSLSLR
jgi:hypothetical protein